MASIRKVIVLLVLLAVSAAPALVEFCATSCESQKAAHSSSQPACHHSATSTFEIAPPAAPCGHDHAGFVAAFTANSVAPGPQLRQVALANALVALPALPQHVSVHSAAAPPGRLFDDSTRPLPLRI